MTTEQVPGWAIDRALELTGNPYSDMASRVRNGATKPDKMHMAFATYIAKHEKPPIDPDVELLAQIYEAWDSSMGVNRLRDGNHIPSDLDAIALIKAARERWQGDKP